MKIKDKMIISFFESRKKIISISSDNRTIVPHYRYKNQVKTGETWLCEIISLKKYMIIIYPIKKITINDILGEERLILKKDGTFILVRNKDDRIIIDNINNLRKMLKSEVIGFICRK